MDKRQALRVLDADLGSILNDIGHAHAVISYLVQDYFTSHPDCASDEIAELACRYAQVQHFMYIVDDYSRQAEKALERLMGLDKIIPGGYTALPGNDR